VETGLNFTDKVTEVAYKNEMETEHVQCDASVSTLLLVYGFNSVSKIVYMRLVVFCVFCCDFVFLSFAALDAK